MKRAIFVAMFLLFAVQILLADDAKVPSDTMPSKESANYQKAEKLLPGEEVVTPTGQKIKVWSTEGPVKVNKAPEPFADQEKSVADDAHIVIDATEVLDRNQQKNADQEQNEEQNKVIRKDSFDVRSR